MLGIFRSGAVPGFSLVIIDNNFSQYPIVSAVVAITKVSSNQIIFYRCWTSEYTQETSWKFEISDSPVNLSSQK